MMQDIPKENQSDVDRAYRFGDFELYASDRLLKRRGIPVQLQPKSFDALLCLLRKAQRLVTKQELTLALWPSVHVSEANLTNIIVTLRKLLGPTAISTVSKYGYRLELPVVGEPGVSRSSYERFVHAKDLTAERGLESMRRARDLFWTCIAEDPAFASAWAWFGRCCWFEDKYAPNSLAAVSLAHSAFRRAFALDPDLSSAHQFYTPVQVDNGQSENAMHRLLDRLLRHPNEPESHAGLVQVFRFRGLLQKSLEAHRRAIELDPSIATSVAPTLFLTGDYMSVVKMYGSGRAAYYLDAAAWAAMGEQERARNLLRERLDKMSLSPLVASLIRSLLAITEGKNDDAVHIMSEVDPTRDPDILIFWARHYSHLGLLDLAEATLKQAVQSGFVCSPDTLRSDPWLKAVRKKPSFRSFFKKSEALVSEGLMQANTLTARMVS